MKIFRAADAFCARRREGPYRFIQNRSRTSVVAPKSGAAAEKSKDQLSRDFLGVVRFSAFATISPYERTSIRRSVSCEFVEPVQCDLPCPVPSAKISCYACRANHLYKLARP